MIGTHAASHHMTSPANVCLQRTSTHLGTHIFDHATYFFRFGNSQKTQIAMVDVEASLIPVYS